MTDVSRRGLLKTAGAIGAGAALTSVPTVAAAQPVTPAANQTSAAGRRRRSRPVDIGDRLELMAGTQVIDQLDGAELRLHQPARREIVMTTDRPWEGSQSHFRHIFRDGDGYRMYYSALDINFNDGRIEHPHPSRLALAESTDGITWTRPNLGLVEHDGSTDNNLVGGFSGIPGGKFVFKDTNPATTPDARYKAVVRDRFVALYAYKSADGLTFEPLSDTPMMEAGADGGYGLTNMSFDSFNVAFWDHEIGKYRLYLRYYRDRESGDGTYRNILTSTSDDFLTWTIPEPLEYPGSPEPEEQLYTNNVLPYYRAPHVLLGFPMRYIQPPGWMQSHYHLPGLEHRRQRFIANERLGTAMTDSLFMSSRDGTVFDRWDEPFIAPGPSPENWKYGDNSMGRGIVVTASDIQGAPDELSFYATEGYWTGDELYVVRYAMRVDGFVSVNAPRTGGEVITRPLRFSGEQLVLNLATSAAGQVRVEIQNAGGRPINGFRLEESDPLFGNDLARPVSWRRGDTDLSSLRNRPVRLRLALNDADVYSMRFRPATTFENTQVIVDRYHDNGILTSSQQQDLLTRLADAETAAGQGDADDAQAALDRFITVATGVSDDAARGSLIEAAEELKRQVFVATTEWPTRYGWLYDTDPPTGNLAHIGLSTARFALDYRNRSIGAAFWDPATIVKLTLRDDDLSAAEGTRLTPDDLSVYVSDSNNSDWRMVEGVQVSPIDGGFEFTGLNETTRYVKVVQPYADDAFTFTNQVSKMLEVTTA